MGSLVWDFVVVVEVPLVSKNLRAPTNINHMYLRQIEHSNSSRSVSEISWLV